MVIDKLLQCESVYAGIGTAGRQGRGFQRSSLSQQSWALPGVNLAGSEDGCADARHCTTGRIG